MGKKKITASFCEINPDKAALKKTAGSVFYCHRGNFRWQGIRDVPYKTGGKGWSNIIRRVLIGSHGETARFHVRYFEIFPGGCSSLEHHRHEHVVICVRGCGVVRTGRKKRQIGFMDTVYIAPDDVHQLNNPFDEPFGFFCIVNAKRDRPKVVEKKGKTGKPRNAGN